MRLGVARGGGMRTRVGKTTLEVVEGDITTQDTDAVVNAANSGLVGGGGVDGAIHRAGGPAILEACRRIRAEVGRLPAGRAVITTGGRLKAKRVIHTVGPVYGSTEDDARLLASCHRESLSLAVAHGLRSVAFPAISTGAYGKPMDEAARVAIAAVLSFLETGPPLDLVRFVLFGGDALRAFTTAMGELKPDAAG
jgi:O-acetyl-ADP-ribose deacetylase (regulator of RNase III)